MYVQNAFGAWLWFDVEEGYNTTKIATASGAEKLWFDVEEGYNTTKLLLFITLLQLWFDVEEGYNTTFDVDRRLSSSCGLMQKKDITQPR